MSSRTVTRFLNKNGYVSKHTAENIRSIIKKYNYRPNAMAKNLTHQKTMTIGLVLNHISYIGHGDRSYFPLIASGLAEITAQQGYGLFLLETSKESAEKKHGINYLERVLDKSLDGAIIVDSVISEEEIIALEQSYGLPFVAINRFIAKYPGRCVLSDERNKGFELTKKLLERGHRRLALFVGGKGYCETEKFLEGVKMALQHYGGEVEEGDIVFQNSDLGNRGMKFRMKEIMGPKNAPTAAVCATEVTTDLLTRLWYEEHARRLERFEFAGQAVDPDEFLCRGFVYSVAPVAEDMGREAGRLILNMLGGVPERKEHALIKIEDFSILGLEDRHD